MKWILLIGAATLLFFTNPSLENHKLAAANEGMEVLKETELNGIFSLFGGGEDFVINLLKSATHRRDYYLFSVTEISLGEDTAPQTIGIGILGQVFIFPQVKQELISQIDMLKSGANLFLND